MQTRLADWGVGYLVNGANADDLRDHRPGLRAAREFQVYSPLADVALTKEEVRQLARQWQLSVAEKPATPCLSSRIAYGESVTRERLDQIDQAEVWLREQGLFDTRVRYHAGDLARLEVQLTDLPRLTCEPLRTQVIRTAAATGLQVCHARSAGASLGQPQYADPAGTTRAVRLTRTWRQRQRSRPTTTEALCPPKPKLLLMATRTVRSLACRGV